MRVGCVSACDVCWLQEERSKVDDLRGTPMAVGTLEEIIDDNHAIVSTSVGSEYYVNMLSFVDKDLIEPGCTVLLNNKVHHYQHVHVHEGPACAHRASPAYSCSSPM